MVTGLFLLDDARYWRGRADEVRAVAETVGDAESKRILADIAESYEHLARRADNRVHLVPE
jgi:hypothetical protein